jgi:hypothetical protein
VLWIFVGSGADFWVGGALFYFIGFFAFCFNFVLKHVMVVLTMCCGRFYLHISFYDSMCSAIFMSKVKKVCNYGVPGGLHFCF